MGGAVAVAAIAFAVAGRRTVSLLNVDMRLPAAGRVDRRLLAGALVFGVGWGVAGFCPGPALVALGIGSGKALAFVAAMIVGMALVGLVDRRPRAAPETLAPPMQAENRPR